MGVQFGHESVLTRKSANDNGLSRIKHDIGMDAWPKPVQAGWGGSKCKIPCVVHRYAC